MATNKNSTKQIAEFIKNSIIEAQKLTWNQIIKFIVILVVKVILTLIFVGGMFFIIKNI